MLKPLLNFFLKDKLTPEQIEVLANGAEHEAEYQRSMGPYRSDGPATSIALPKDRFDGLRVIIIGCDGVPEAKSFADIMAVFLPTLRGAIGKTFGSQYEKWFTHALLYVEYDLSHYVEGHSSYLRLVYRDAADQGIGANIMGSVWSAMANNANAPLPDVKIVNCYREYSYEGVSDDADPLPDGDECKCEDCEGGEVRVPAKDV